MNSLKSHHIEPTEARAPWVPLLLFHATQREDWLATAQAAHLWVHVGDRSAAEDRSRVVCSGGALLRLAQYNLHALALERKARIYPRLIRDVGGCWSDNMDDTGFDAFVYKNEYENPGSYSLFVAARSLSEHSVEVLEPEADLRQTLAVRRR